MRHQILTTVTVNIMFLRCDAVWFELYLSLFRKNCVIHLQGNICTRKMEALSSSEMLVPLYQTTPIWVHMPKDKIFRYFSFIIFAVFYQ